MVRLHCVASGGMFSTRKWEMLQAVFLLVVVVVLFSSSPLSNVNYKRSRKSSHRKHVVIPLVHFFISEATGLVKPYSSSDVENEPHARKGKDSPAVKITSRRRKRRGAALIEGIQHFRDGLS